jgi:hypothetical protein
MDDYRTADSLGAGLTLDADREVTVVLMVTVGEETIAVPLTVEMAEDMIESLEGLTREAHLVREATLTMPPESAREYLDNWNARLRG